VTVILKCPAGGRRRHRLRQQGGSDDLTRADLDALGGVETIMREITRRISCGIGVPAQERVDHPVLDKIRSAEFARSASTSSCRSRSSAPSAREITTCT
jgi:hypothetical protein